MPLDDGYQPSVPFEINSVPRVMRLSTLDKNTRRRLQRAIDGLPEVETPTVVMTTDNWWCYKDGTLRDFLVGAQKSADRTGHTQVVHMHTNEEDCAGHEHHTIQPDPVHAAAWGGTKHA